MERLSSHDRADLVAKVIKGQLSLTQAIDKYGITQSAYDKWADEYHRAGLRSLRGGANALRVWRYAFAAFLGLFVFTYLCLIMAGRLNASERLDATSLGLLAIAAVAIVLVTTPHLLQEIKSFEFGQLKVELDRVQELQVDQQEQLRLIRLILPLLLPDPLPMYLRCIKERVDRRFNGSHELRSALRKLATARLIQRSPGVSIHDAAADDKPPFFLHEFLTITKLGRDWVDQIEAMETDRQQD